MLFTEPIFFFFFAMVFLVYWAIPVNSGRKLLLLAASYVFYGAWDWRFLLLIFASTVIDYAVGLVLRGDAPRGGRKAWLIISLAANLGILGFFKYFNFFVDSGASLLTALGMEVGDRTLQIVLPVGISFFTFQTMSYTIDVYHRRIEPVTRFTDFALFVAFFPQLVAGPIVRAAEFLPQLAEKRCLRTVAFRPLLTLFLVGFFKKAIVSDTLAPIVDRVYEQPELYNTFAHWVAASCYTVQIYCDFSGYTDMAIAVAGLLGYKLCLNFNFPYFAANVTDFWRRWHISLSSWLRDYLYIALGGNRGTLLFTYRNLLLTMLLGGLWHGAAWTFVVWGGIHGLALILHREFGNYTGKLPKGFHVAMRWLAPLLTLYYVQLTWVFFRAASFEDAWLVLKSMAFIPSEGLRSADMFYACALVPLYLLHFASYKGWLTPLHRNLPDPLFSIIYALAWLVTLLFLPASYQPFIYFQF